MHQLKTALIGCGKAGRLHANALKRIPESEFVAVCSANVEHARSFAAEFGVRAYARLEDLLAESGAEMITVATPHPRHADAAVQAARAGLHVLVEKPLAASLADCDRMLAAAREAGRTLGTLCQRRFYAPCRRIHEAIAAGKIGRPILGAVTLCGWRDAAYYRSDPWRGTWVGEGGGVLVNQAPHQLDLLLWYLGPVEELYGGWANFNHPTIEVEDTAVATLRFRNGGLGTILVSNAQNPALYGRVQVHGSNGASVGVQTDGGAMFIAGVTPIAEPPVNDLWTVRGEEHLLAEWRRQDTELFGRIAPTEHFHHEQIREFIQAVLAGRPPLVTGEDGRRTVELFTAIYQSQRERRPIRFPVAS